MVVEYEEEQRGEDAAHSNLGPRLGVNHVSVPICR